VDIVERDMDGLARPEKASAVGRTDIVQVVRRRIGRSPGVACGELREDALQ
jgi:hypothetical protein